MRAFLIVWTLVAALATTGVLLVVGWHPQIALNGASPAPGSSGALRIARPDADPATTGSVAPKPAPVVEAQAPADRKTAESAVTKPAPLDVSAAKNAALAPKQDVAAVQETQSPPRAAPVSTPMTRDAPVATPAPTAAEKSAAPETPRSDVAAVAAPAPAEKPPVMDKAKTAIAATPAETPEVSEPVRPATPAQHVASRPAADEAVAPRAAEAAPARVAKPIAAVTPRRAKTAVAPVQPRRQPPRKLAVDRSKQSVRTASRPPANLRRSTRYAETNDAAMSAAMQPSLPRANRSLEQFLDDFDRMGATYLHERITPQGRTVVYR